MGEDSSRHRHRSKSPSRDERERKHSSKDKHKRRDRSEEADERRSKHRRSKHDEDKDERKKDRKDRKDKDKSRESRKTRPEGLEIVDDDDGDVWVEKDLDTTHATSNVPTSLSLPLRSNPNDPPPKVELHRQTAAASVEADRPAWMLDPTEHSSVTVPMDRDGAPHSLTDGHGELGEGARSLGGGVDFFSDLGTQKKRKDPNENKPDPSKVVIHRNELNEQLKQGKTVDEYVSTERKVVPGGPGHQWRMMKLRRLYEEAEESQRPIDEVAMERYGSMEDFQEAVEERRVLDEREQRRNARRGGGSGTDNSAPGSTGMRTPDASGNRRFVFTNTAGEEPFSSRPSSRAGFRRPGEDSNVGTPSGRVEELKRTMSSSSLGGTTPQGAGRSMPRQFDSKPQTPIPSVFAPRSAAPAAPAAPVAVAEPDPTASRAVMSIGELNKMQAKVLRAKLMEDPEAENLEAEYDLERHRFEVAGGGDNGNGLWAGAEDGVQGQMGREDDGNRVQVQMLPTLDGHGRLYDVGVGKGDDERVLPGNRRKKPEKFETRDRTGQLLRINADDDTQTLGDLVRQERFGGGAADQKNLDYEMANAIAKDGKYSDTHDYMDENAERLARKKMKTDAMKRQFAINDYARTKKALDSCEFCYQEEAPPQTAIVALGARTYLCCTQTEELVPGHCLIVPIQHHLSTLEMEDDDWEEVKNFMKCLMRMYAKENKGVVFFETCLSFRQQRHTYIEAIPIPANEYSDAPAYFKEAILASETEWSQHKKLIDFSTRPGGFRRAMVSNLPYFMVQFDYRGERGYGHVIEGLGDAPGKGVGENDDGALDEGDNGGGEFPRYFAAEIIGNMLQVEARKWRRPQRIDTALNKHRARELGTRFQPFDWTLGLQEQS